MKLRKTILPKKMNNKILLYSMLIVVVSIISSSLVYQQINRQFLFDSISQVNNQTTIYVKSNIENIINSVNSYSKLIIGNETIQNALDEDKGKLLVRQALLLQLNTLMESTPFISDIYLSDLEGNLYVAYKNKVINPDYLTSDVVKEAIRDNGSYSLHLRGGDYFQSYGKDSFISFVRAIKDLNTLEIIGVLVINIPTSHLVSKQGGTADDIVQDLYIVSQKDVVIHSGTLGDDLSPFTSNLKKVNGYITDKIYYKDQDFLLSSFWMETLDWHIVSIISLNQSTGVIDHYKIATGIIIMINLMFIFVGVALFSSQFVRPMKKMIATIRSNGENLECIDLNTHIYELSQLELEYNEMIVKIKVLIKNKVDEQKSLRKKELELLQAQIKPHFLYNTLDTIKLLAKKGENEMAFQAVKALGKFYRSSLGRGKETIQIAEEIDIVVNYMTIQNFRYKDNFELRTYLDPMIGNYKILRLVLQPLVENALYHGIRPKGEHGIITVSVFKDNKSIVFVVEDDGVGFDVHSLAKDKENHAIKLDGYGVNNTIERLRIFYGKEVDFNIESNRGIGTKVSIIIPEELIVNQNEMGEQNG